MSETHLQIETVAGELSTLAGELADETECRRGLADSLVAGLRDSGVLRAGAPLEVGGLELAPGVALRCAEEVARGDASAGWCVSIAMTSSLLAAYLPADSRYDLFGDGQVAGGVWAPRGTARSVDRGVVVSGQWPFCSGIGHADVLFFGCMTGERPLPSVVALLKEDVRILDTWHTLGLRGTGSNDAVADDVFVPASRVFSLFNGPTLDRPLYRFPIFGYFALSVAAAALGNARAAIDNLIALAGEKVPQGASRALAARPATQAAVADAVASLRAARALYYDVVEVAWHAAEDEAPVPVAQRNDLRLAATHAVRTSAAVVRAMYDLGGGSSIYDASPLQRRFRDAHTITAHFQTNEASRELPGRILLGQPSDPTTL